MRRYFAKAIREQEESLSHHGILGQKWGIRRFQNKDGTRTALGKARESSGKGKIKVGTSAVSYYDNALRPLGTGFNFSRSKRYSPNTPEWHQAHVQDREDMRAAREAIVQRKKFYEEHGEDALEGLSGEGSYQYTKHTHRTDGKMDWMAFDTATIVGDPGERRTSPEEIQEAVNSTNPMFSTGAYGWQNNCPACSAVLTMKKMGYSEDLTASPLHDGASRTNGIQQWFNGAKTEDVGSIENLESTISGYGAGSFGSMSGSRYATDQNGSSRRIGGHEMGFTVLGDGKIQIECGQSGKIYGSLQEAAQDQGFATDRGFTVTRLDNTTPNLVNMAADGVLSTLSAREAANGQKRSSSIVINTENGKLVDDSDYYYYQHAGNHDFWR